MIKLVDLYNSVLQESIPTVSPQDAHDRNLFGPLYHGTTPENMANIIDRGFDITPPVQRNGYMNKIYALGYPPPVHHLGYGVYLTTVKNIAIMFNNNTTRGLHTFFADIPRLETINFGSPKNMMQWWLDHGYDGELANTSESGRVKATQKMTEVIKSKYDGVWFKGKGLHRLLDGDQVCVYNPDRIFLIDNAQASGLEIGAKVVLVKDVMEYIHHIKFDGGKHVVRTRYPMYIPGPQETLIGTDPVVKIPVGTKGVIRSVRSRPEKFGGGNYYEIKFTPGGTELNITGDMIKPLKP